MSLVAIANACAVECERQHVGIQELQYLLAAYKNVADAPHYFTEMASDFLRIGQIVEPVKNRNGFRTTPVTFQNGGSSANASQIPRLMEQLIQAIADTEWQYMPNHAQAFVREFLWIHPFADGNGRVGFLLYNYLMGTLDEPLALPDFAW